MLFQVYSQVIQIYVFLFQILFHYRLLQGTEYSCLRYTVGPCWLSILQSNFLFTKFKCPFKPAVDAADFSHDTAEAVYLASAAEADIPVLSY